MKNAPIIEEKPILVETHDGNKILSKIFQAFLELKNVKRYSRYRSKLFLIKRNMTFKDFPKNMFSKKWVMNGEKKTINF